MDTKRLIEATRESVKALREETKVIEGEAKALREEAASVSYYSVLRLMADELSEEFVNIGVMVVWNGGYLFRPIQGDALARAAVFSGYSEERILEILDTYGAPARYPLRSKEEMARLSKQWVNAIRLSPPRGAVIGAQQLADAMEERFLSILAKGRA